MWDDTRDAIVRAGASACREVGRLEGGSDSVALLSCKASFRPGESRSRSLAESLAELRSVMGAGEEGGLASRGRDRLHGGPWALETGTRPRDVVCGAGDEERASRDTSSSEMSSSKVFGEPGLMRSSSSSSRGDRVSASRRVAGMPVAPNCCILEGRVR